MEKKEIIGFNKKRDGLSTPTMLPAFIIFFFICGLFIISGLERYYQSPLSTFTKVIILGISILIGIGLGILQIIAFSKAIEKENLKNKEIIESTEEGEK